jgi:hypothetical protein
MLDLAAHLHQRNAQLVAQKQLHEQVWKDCYDLTQPARAHGLLSEIISATDAQQRKAVILDSTPGDAVKVGAASIQGGMIPANAQWFGLDVGQETDAERAFIDATAKFLWENIHASNFDAEAFDAMTDVMIAGWPVLYCDERDEGGFYFETWPIGQCAIGSSRSGSLIDTVYRTYEYTVSQCVAEFGEANVSQTVRDKYAASKFDDKVKLLHAIEPRQMRLVGSQRAKDLPVASYHMECDTRHILRESGYHEFPCMVPRWSRLPGSGYATGPMSDALPDARTLNELVKWSLMGAETVIAPMLKVVDDGVINARNIKVGPRKILPCADINNIEALNTGSKVEFAEVKAERLQASIRKILLADQLPPADGPVKTAYEWSVRVETMRKMLGPMFGRFQSEFLQPLIERCFGIAWRANARSGYRLLGRPPESLLGRAFTVRYLSPLARAQRLEEVAAMDRFEVALVQEAQIDPTVVDVYDLDAAARERSVLLGVPQKLLRDAKALKQLRDARLKAQQQAQQQAVAEQGQLDMQGAMAQRMAAA